MEHEASFSPIQWFKKDQPPPEAYVKFDADGYFTFDAPARRMLPPYVCMGFDWQSQLLYFQESSPGEGLPTKKKAAFQELTRSMRDAGVRFPIQYRIQISPEGQGLWEALPPARDKERLTQAIRCKEDLREARSCLEMGQLVSLYDAVLKKICRSFTRSIPREDRLQLAREAFVNAFFSHKPNLENFDDYLKKEVRSHLKSRIGDHAGYYREPYPLTKTGEDGSEYEVYGDPAAEREYEKARTKLDLAQVLSPLEQEIYALQLQGYLRKEICHMKRVNVCVYNKAAARIKRTLAWLGE